MVLKFSKLYFSSLNLQKFKNTLTYHQVKIQKIHFPIKSIKKHPTLMTTKFLSPPNSKTHTSVACLYYLIDILKFIQNSLYFVYPPDLPYTPIC